MPAQTFECQHCKQQVSRRKSVAIQPDEKQADKFVAVRSKTGQPIVRKALPRRHRGKCPE